MIFLCLFGFLFGWVFGGEKSLFVFVILVLFALIREKKGEFWQFQEIPPTTYMCSWDTIVLDTFIPQPFILDLQIILKGNKLFSSYR